jgi:hypothetical protein
MNNIVVIVIAAFAATSAMTIFSYILSDAFRKLYKEPLLLEYLIAGMHLNISTAAKKISAWLIHYLIGLFFVWTYFFLFEKGWYTISWRSGIIFGCIIGIIGIIGWRIMFALSPRKVPVRLSEYFLQLFLAHLIFAFTTIGVYFVARHL